MGFTYSLSSSLDLMVGQYVGVPSQSGSEFGGRLPVGNSLELGLPNMTYALIRYYF